MPTSYTMSPGELAQYQGRKNAARSDFRMGQAQNQYGRGLLDQQYGIQQRDLRKQFADMRVKQPGSMIQRGVFRSGLQTRGLQDLAKSRVNAFSDAAMGYQGQAGQFALQNSALEGTLQNSLQQIESERLARQAELAAQIRAVMAGR
jgi:hypothetical protein